MSAVVAPAQIRRLGKLLGMLGSAHDGERANAAAAADRHLRSIGLDWDTLVSRAFAAPPAVPAAPPPRRRPDFDARAQVAWCLDRADYLSPWENAFLRSFSGRRGGFSPKQIAKITQIAQAVETRAAGWPE